HATATPVPPSKRTDNPIPADLEALILRCLAKAPSARPESAASLRRALDAVPAHRDWDETAAAVWWRDFEARRPPRVASPPDPAKVTVTITRDLGELRADRTEVDVDAFTATRRMR